MSSEIFKVWWLISFAKLILLDDSVCQVLQFERIIGLWLPYAATRDAVHPGPNYPPQSKVAKYDFGHYGSGFLVPFHS